MAEDKTANIRIKRELISDHFRELILSKARYLIAFGGRSSGKTKHFYIRYIYESFEDKHFKLLYINNEFTNIREGQFAGFKTTIEELGLTEYFKFYESDYRIQNTLTGNWVIPKGLDKPEKTKGIEDITNIWIDEVNKCTEEAVKKVNRLLKTPKADYLQLAISFNPVSEKHWLRDFYFDKTGYKPHERFKSIYVNHSTVYNNEFIDIDAYVEEIINDANGDPSQLDCDLKGIWGNIKKKNLFIYGFKKSKHVVKDIPLRKDFMQWVSIDFNVDPMTSLIFQFGYDKIEKEEFLEVIDEIVERGENDEGAGVYELCENLQAGYDTDWCYFVGDSSGWKRNVNARKAKSSWEIINEELDLNRSQNKTPKGKKAVTGTSYVVDKRSITNYLFQKHPNVRIASHCTNLIEDLETVQATSEGKMDKKDKSKAHLLDCLTDFCITMVRQKRIFLKDYA